MSVRPTGFHPDGSVEVWHDELPHGGTVSAVSITFGTRLQDGAPLIQFLTLPCPSCGALCLHPASGGAAPDAVQRLFAYQYLRETTIAELSAIDTWDQAKAKLADVIEALDGPGHFRLQNVVQGG